VKVTYNWLKDFVEIRISPDELAHKLTMAGLEVTSLEKKEGDFVFEIEITSNRADCLSVVGIAREVAAITNRRVKRAPAKIYTPRSSKAQAISIKIEDKKDCPLYTAKIIRDVEVGPSPVWLKERLELIGCRSINNIVDITNYVLFTYGEPLHAFDLDKIYSQLASGSASQLNIGVRRARKGEEIVTIDGEKRLLSNRILVITSGTKLHPACRQAGHDKPIAIAGIMGGIEAEVTETTKNVLLEAAVFDAIVVRRAKQSLGLTSESAYRFERGVDPTVVESASWRTAELINELAKGKCSLSSSSGGHKYKRKRINLEIATTERILGVNIAPPKIKKILGNLGFKISSKKIKNTLSVEVPSHRPDVAKEIDLVEEIARVFGYENIPTSLPSVKPQATLYDPQGLVLVIKNILVGLGLKEVITYSLLDRDLLDSFKIGNDSRIIEILNPLSREQEILRPTLIPSLSACIAYNLNQRQDYINIFEAAKIFFHSNGKSQEELVLGVALCGEKSLLFPQGQVRDKVGILHLKGILEVICGRLGIDDYDVSADASSGAVNIYIHGEKAGFMLGLQKNTLDRLNIKNKEVFVLELSLGRVFSSLNLEKKFSGLPKYPGITRDISFILKEEIPLNEVLKATQDAAKPLLRDIKIVDYYRGKQIPPGHRGLTVSFLYRSDERTLTEEEINPLHNLICGIITEKFKARIR